MNQIKSTKQPLPHLDDFLLNLQTNNLSVETVYNYERDLKVFQDFLNNEMRISFNNINKTTLLRYKAYLSSQDRLTAENKISEKRLSSFSMNRMLSVLRSYTKFLIDMDYECSISPEMIKLVKTEKKSPRVSEFKDVIKLIESPTELEKNKKIALRNRAMLEMLFSTGMRISELVNLKRTQIDETGSIFIMGKGKKERFVYLTGRAEKHLNGYLKVRGIVESPYLFIPYRGRNIKNKYKKISPNYLQEKIKRYREILRINTPLSAHGLRHAFATYLAENGATAAAIQILLGHESLDTTTRYVNASQKFAEGIHKKFHPLKD